MTEARFHARIDAIPAADWDALRPDDNPFLAHAFLAALENYGCLQTRHGWTPHHLGLYDGERLVAAAPCYLKGNSHGEFVFDHGWAEAYWRHGLDYYPKLLCAVPYSPVPGPRLLCGDASDGVLRAACLDALRAETDRLLLSSAHLNFDGDGRMAVDWLPRFDWQFHWRHQGWPDFEAFLDDLTSRKRKNIRQERAQVRRAGIDFRQVGGAEATEGDLGFVHACYRRTFAEKGNLPVMSREFFSSIARTMPANLLLVIAERKGQPIASAIFLRSSTRLYGRYWGSFEAVPGLHFETCYYQGIEYCLEHGLQVFEPGAQGEHKLARGFLPVPTRSLHYLRDSRFRDAAASALAREAAWLRRYRDELMRHAPYRAPTDPPAPA